jgi:transcriptional regulator with XRE-family HTH domain
MNSVSNQNLLKEIGLKLAELRKQKGFKSHEGFALAYDLPRVQYWRLEKGKANFTIKTLMKILSIHNVEPEDFFATIDTPVEKNQSAKE